MVNGELQLDGTIRANGGDATATYSAGGSGGSVWVDAHSVTGSGHLQANGGNGLYRGGGGGGGRLAVYYWDSLTWPTGNVSVAGGTTTSASYGRGGTVHIQKKDAEWWSHAELVGISFPSNGVVWLNMACPGSGWSNVLEKCTSLESGNWVPVYSSVGHLPDIQWSDVRTNGATRAFYRVKSVPLP